MPKITISQINDRILTAMAEERDTIPEAILDHILADIRINRAGIRHDDTPDEIEARVSKLERKGADAKAARKAVEEAAKKVADEAAKKASEEAAKKAQSEQSEAEDQA